MSRFHIDKFVKENGPLIIAGLDGKPTINVKHAVHFYTQFGIPAETFQDWVNELLASGGPLSNAV